MSDLRETLTKNFRHDELVDEVIAARQRAESAEQRVKDLETDVERLKEWCATGEKQLKGRQDYARDQLQRAEAAELSNKVLTDKYNSAVSKLCEAEQGVKELCAEIARCARKEAWPDTHPLEQLRAKLGGE